MYLVDLAARVICLRMIDFDKPLPLWYCILMVAVLASLIRIVIGGLNRNAAMSRSSRLIRVVGGGFWALAVLGGMAFQIFKALR